MKWILRIGLLGCVAAIALSVVLLVVYVPLAVLGIVPIPGACQSEVRQQIKDLGGFDIEVRETNCDVLAKEEWADVSIAEKGGKQKMEVIFRYVPTSNPDVQPTLRMPSPGNLLISIPVVSSVTLQRDSWRSLLIDYDIERIFVAQGSERTKPVHLKQDRPTQRP